MTQREIYTDPKDVTPHHFAAIRLVICRRQDSWTRYIVLDRRKILARVKQERRKGVRWNLIGWIAYPNWCATESGPGGPFRGFPSRIANNRRYIVVAQSGGLDV